MPSNMALVLGSLGAAYIFFSALLHYTQDSNEPPAVETSIPFISPLFGLIPGMPKFLVQLRSVRARRHATFAIQTILKKANGTLTVINMTSPSLRCACLVSASTSSTPSLL